MRPVTKGVATAAVIVLAVALGATSVSAATTTTRLVSRTSAGDPADNGGDQPAISGNGQFVAFQSNSDNLPGPDPSMYRIYVHDRIARTTALVSKTSGGVAADGGSTYPTLSFDGRLVAFLSSADNLPQGDGTTLRVYVHDRRTHRTTLVSKATDGTPAKGQDPFLSPNGRFIGFTSNDGALPPGDGTKPRVYLHDRETGRTLLVSRTGSGEPTSGSEPTLSSDGRFVAFQSADPALPPGGGSTQLVYVRDRMQKTTELVSKTSTGTAADRNCSTPAISGTGVVVVFDCYATNLPRGNENITRIYAHNRQTARTRLVSVNDAGRAAATQSYDPSISGDGRMVTFYTDADNMPGTNGTYDVFIRDLQANTTRLASRNSAGQAAAGNSEAYHPSLSSDGKWVIFRSEGTNLAGAGGGSLQTYVRGPMI